MKILVDNEKRCELTFQEDLELRVGIKLRLKINDNCSTMLSIKWEAAGTKISLHRMFLEAPQNVMQALACYLKGEHTTLAPTIKAYIENGLQKLDYSHELDLTTLETQGSVYDLKAMYDKVNREYFNNSLDLRITWFGHKRQRCGAKKITFGIYHDPFRLIKINRMLDNALFPDFFISFVIYHEMLHFVCPSYVDINGQKRIHSKEFKEREREFKQYDCAMSWIRRWQSGQKIISNLGETPVLVKLK